jgi:phosphoribosyl-ATP pyrophosphohydrolase
MAKSSKTTVAETPVSAPEKPAKSKPIAKAKKADKPAKPAPVPPPEPADPLGRLFHRVDTAKNGNPEKSYTAKLFGRGRAKIAQKLGEEAVETTIELVKGDRKGVISESADLLYHLMLAWADAGITPDDVWTELQRRQGISGLVEKASRKPD